MDVNPYESPLVDDTREVAPARLVKPEPEFDHFVWVGLAMAVAANGLVLASPLLLLREPFLAVLGVLTGIVAGVPMNIGGICTAAPGQRWAGVVGIALSLTPWPLFLFLDW